MRIALHIFLLFLFLNPPNFILLMFFTISSDHIFTAFWGTAFYYLKVLTIELYLLLLLLLMLGLVHVCAWGLLGLQICALILIALLVLCFVDVGIFMRFFVSVYTFSSRFFHRLAIGLAMLLKLVLDPLINLTIVTGIICTRTIFLIN